jgi:hypothetical protein
MSWSWNKRVQNLKLKASMLVIPVALIVASAGGFFRVIGFHW